MARPELRKHATFEEAVPRCEAHRCMTRQEYSNAYVHGFRLTARYLLSRGASAESAEEFSEAGWTKGWEHLGTLRNPQMVVWWVNTIALNLFRTSFRRREDAQPLPEIGISPSVDAGTIDLHRTLEKCKQTTRTLLERHYVEGYTSAEVAQQMGCTPVSIRVRLLRTRRRLKEELRPKRAGVLNRVKESC